MIYCCGRMQEPVKKLRLANDFRYRERFLNVIVCNVCGKVIAEIIQYDVKKQKLIKKRLAKRQLAKFLERLKDGSWQEIKNEYGTKGKAGFIYGVNRVDKNGKIYQYSVDFNGTKTLVKIIN
ncbi:hypothetical protein IJ182_01355 [bacterium]|nr:hypothetical protein [bacterium]